MSDALGKLPKEVQELLAKHELELAKYRRALFDELVDHAAAWNIKVGSLNAAERSTSLRSEAAIAQIRTALIRSDDLRKKQWRGDSNPYAGHCYVASEALYFLLGGKKAGLTPMTLRIDGVTHWFLRAANGAILDPTADQFDKLPNYSKARGRGFLTPGPSNRARELIRRIGAA